MAPHRRRPRPQMSPPPQRLEWRPKKSPSSPSMETQVVNFFALLPPQVISKITASLPLKSIARCLLVCKLWRKVLSNPLVAKGIAHFLFFNRQTNEFAVLNDDPLESKIQPDEVMRLQPLPLPPATRYCKHEPLLIDMYGVHSCNGLLCLPVKNNSLLYLFNPVIGECALVPKPIIDDYYTHMYDLGYCPNTDKFKITRFIGRRYDEDTAELEIFTLGSPHGWKTFTGEVPNQIWEKSEPATFAKGVLHWLLLLEGKKRSILTFDLEEESFGSVPLPALDDNKEIYKMGFMDNSLVVTAGHNPSLGLEIWARRDCVQGSFWTKNWVIDATDSLNQKTLYTTKLMLLIPIKVSIDGRIFLSHMYEQLVCYDPKKNLVEDFVFAVKEEEVRARNRFAYRNPLVPWSGIIPHTASLVSPKALIEAGGPIKRRRDKGKKKVAGTV